MASIEEVQIILDEIAEELPPEIYKDLNGGIILLPQVKYHKKSVDNDLYVMGEYRNERISGRYKLYTMALSKGFMAILQETGLKINSGQLSNMNFCII